MAGRPGWGEDSIYFDHSGECHDPEAHRHCLGRWRGVVSLKPGPDGQRRRKKVSGKNKTEVRAKLAELHGELNDGVVTNAAYTVAQAIKDWLADGLAGRAPKTVSTQREVLEPLIDIIGAVPLRELSAATVRSALKDLAATRATRTVAMTHAGLTRAIRHAEANDKVRRNVATLVDTPAGQEGRPSKSLTFGQAVALIRAARSYGLYAYVVLSLLVGVRTEEARALRWDRVDLEGNPDATLIDDPVGKGKADFVWLLTLPRAGSWDRTLVAGERIANALEPELRDPLGMQVLGMVTLTTSLAAASLQRSDRAAHWLSQAVGIAQHVPDSPTQNWQSFSTTNVNIWRVTVAVERGEAGSGVLELAHNVSLDLWVPTTTSASCDQAILVDHATNASLSSYAVSFKIDRFG